MRYDYRIGTYESHRAFLSHSLQKLVWLVVGGIVGIVGGLYAAVAITQASVQPLTITYGGDTSDSGNVLPIVHALQQNGSLRIAKTASSVDDLQGAGGYNIVQRTERPQP